MTDAIDAATQPEQKTVHGIFSLIYTAFHEAGKLAQDESLADKTKDLRAALDALPQADIDALVINVTQTYKALESMHVIGVEFNPDPESKMVISTSTLRFGDRDVGLKAPFDHEAASAILKQLKDAILAISPSPILMAH